MKKIIPYVILAVSCLALWYGCKEEEPVTYNDKDKVYFYHYDRRNPKTNPRQVDSLSYSLKVENVTEDRHVINITLQLLGNVSQSDRTVRVRQINEGEEGAAMPGIHFVPLEEIADKIVIPAGSSVGAVPVTVVSTDYLLDSEVCLEMEVLPNENFELGLPAHLTFKLFFSNMYIKPANWDSIWKPFFGASWGQEKFAFLIKYVTGDIDWDDSDPYYSDLSKYWGQLAKEKLIEYNNDPANDPKRPLAERDGTPVTFDS